MADESANQANSLTDEQWMAQALGLAKEAVGLASPNPTVGCLLVRNGILVGHGAHEYDRLDHAEVVALREAGDLARGATAYVTLEPCSHYGRTGPCADALIAAGVARVVVATADANPAVHGRGIEKLHRAGIDVTTGVLQKPAQRLDDAFAKYIRTGLPHITLKAAMSLDGRIAPAPYERKLKEVAWITGVESRKQVQLLRHSVDAVITGIGTVLADDPSLTDRSELSRRRPLLRVILDSHLRLPPDSKLVRSVKEDVLVFCANPPEPSLQALSAAGVVVRQIPSEPGSTRPSLSQILEHLGEMKITSVMVEAGSEVNASFLNAGLVDRLYLFYAPTLLGPEGVPMSQAAFIPDSPIRDFALHRFGNDLAYEARLQEYWHNPESLSLGIGALTAAAQDELELAGLAEKWGAGTFDSTAASLTYHFNAHGAELRAVSLLQYLRKADRFAAKLERSKRAPLPDGSVRYTENDRYAIKSADGKILSLGLVADERGRAD